ncbi:maleylpyruvate isomerase N-terminal domain-containing protein [Knoellia sp. CPCC 206450]|uniref:maleylpyruvate isomerase N-terminal domain-containing protein n=1 Tax=Knoellia tibetensis TaxID=3404798 RepID=UPI003B432EF1
MAVAALHDRARLTDALVASTRASIDLAAHAEVRDAWERDSACSGMTVGGLAHHLLAQTGHIVRGLRVPAPGDAPVIGLLDHYSQAPWVAASRDGETDPDQDEKDNAAAAAGHEAVVAGARQALAELPEALARPRDPDVVHIPWQGWSLATPDFATTRMMEMVVHGDDLAASVGLPTPEHDPLVVEAVLDLLVHVSLSRHGQVALVRALSRPQRSGGDVSAF